MAWLYLSGERFEKDPARAAAQKAEAKRLDERARALREKEIKESKEGRQAVRPALVRPRRISVSTQPAAKPPMCAM